MTRLTAAALVLLSTSIAGATPLPQLELDAAGRHKFAEPVAQPTLPTLPTPYSLPPILGTDLLDREVVASLDPATGATNARLNLTLVANQGSVSSINFYIDAGLSVVGLTSSQPGATFSQGVVQYVNYVTVYFDPLIEGEQMMLSVDYNGTLACVSSTACDIQPTMSVLFQGSVIPTVIDESGLGGYNVWGTPRALELSMPSGTDIVAPGAVTLDVDNGTTHTMRFEVPGYHTAGAYLVMFGDFDTTTVPNATPLTNVVSAADQPQWNEEMVVWMQRITAFLDAQAGMPLQWDHTDVVKLPANWVFPGTAGHGIVLLAETYGLGTGSAAYFEETLAHETAHEWWGILVSPTDYITSRWLVEGLATLSQIDYAADVQNPTVDRDAYLARRYREHDILMRYMVTNTIPAVVPAFPIDAGEDDTLWAYIRSSAALDTLRVLVGKEAFDDALRLWAATCAFEHCDTADFKSMLEMSAGRDLTDAFDAYVYRPTFPAPTLSWTESDGAVSVTATDFDVPLPMELVVLHDDRSRSRQQVVLVPGAATTFEAPPGVRAVIPNPRHDPVVRSTSVVPTDNNFDLEVDGMDVINCARALGTGFTPGGGDEGLIRIDLDFLPRCDLNADGAITANDVDGVLQSFGTAKEAP